MKKLLITIGLVLAPLSVFAVVQNTQWSTDSNTHLTFPLRSSDDVQIGTVSATSTIQKLLVHGTTTLDSFTSNWGQFFVGNYTLASTSPYSDVTIMTGTGNTELTLYSGFIQTGHMIDMYLFGATSPGFTVDKSFRLGLSSSTPGSALSIGATGNGINLKTGTSTWNTTGGINLHSSGCFAIDDVCVEGAVGPGLVGQVGYYNANGTKQIGTSTVFIDTMSEVGIGTTTPFWKLNVVGTQPSIAISDISAATNQKHWVMSSEGGNFYMGTSTDAGATSTPVLSVNTIGSGGMQIGTTTNNALLALGTSTVDRASLSIGPGLIPTTQNNGDIWVSTTTQTLDTFIGNIWGSAERVIFTASADKVVTNTNVDTTAIPTGIGTTSLPANFWTPGKTVHIHGQGLYALPIGGGSATVKVKYGGTTLASKTTSGLLANASNLQWWFDADVTCRTVGSTGTVVISGQISYSSNAATNIAVSDPLQTTNGSAVTIDTTSANLFDVTVAFDTAATTKIATTTVVTYEVKN